MSRARVHCTEPEGLRVVHAPRWWRDYHAECLDWWTEYVNHPATTRNAMIAFLVARFGGPDAEPLCALTPSDHLAALFPRR